MAKTKVVRGTCTVPGCTRPHKARGYCPAHLQRWMRGAPVNVALRSRDATPKEHCSEPECQEAVKAKGLCKMHYARLLRHGHTKHPDRKTQPSPCAIPGCENHAYAKGVCHPHYQRKALVHKKYGISWEQFEAMQKAQNGLCAICGNPPSTVNGMSGKVYDLNVDHNHDTKAVRGLLCHSCNRGLGMFQDSRDVLRAALAYLEKHAT